MRSRDSASLHLGPRQPGKVPQNGRATGAASGFLLAVAKIKLPQVEPAHMSRDKNQTTVAGRRDEQKGRDVRVARSCWLSTDCCKKFRPLRWGRSSLSNGVRVGAQGGDKE